MHSEVPAQFQNQSGGFTNVSRIRSVVRNESPAPDIKTPTAPAPKPAPTTEEAGEHSPQTQPDASSFRAN